MRTWLAGMPTGADEPGSCTLADFPGRESFLRPRFSCWPCRRIVWGVNWLCVFLGVLRMLGFCVSLLDMSNVVLSGRIVLPV